MLHHPSLHFGFTPSLLRYHSIVLAAYSSSIVYRRRARGLLKGLSLLLKLIFRNSLSYNSCSHDFRSISIGNRNRSEVQMSKKSDEAEESLRKKQQLYEQLEASLNEEDDETPDPGRLSSIQAMQNAAARKRELRMNRDNGSNGLARSTSDSSLTKTKATPSPRLTGADHNSKLPPSLMTRHTFAGSTKNDAANAVPSSVPAKATGKRKRESTVEQVADEQQIFKDLHFYFFPNTDTHPARKMRITKALEFGATWQKEFNGSVTHVIFDKSTEVSQLFKFLKTESLPGNVIVVSENYPAECISFRTLLDPRQLQFKVKGHDMAVPSRPISSGSDRSLQLKPAGESVQARQPETPISDKRAPSPSPLVSLSDGESDCEPPAPTLTKTSSTKVKSTEEFDAAIRQAQQLEHVPLDNDEEATSRPSSSDGPVTDDEQQNTESIFDKKKKNKLQRFQEKFQCMQKHTGSVENPNAATIAILQQMADYYGQVGDEWRTRAYRKAISTLRNHPKKVWTKEEALSLTQIGDRLATKIEEIAFTNRLRRLDNAKAEPSDQVLQTFMGVYGAGFAQASKWVSAGYTSLDELLEKAELTDNQRIGIEHYADFSSRIPRAEVEQHGDIVRRTIRKIDSAFEVIVGGSYRRGAETSGDIDCIITRPNTDIAHIRQVVLDQLVPKLFAKNFLVAELAATSRDDGSKWHGASRIPSSHADGKANPWRRIDFLLVPSDEIGAALIYFTGNDIFNRSLRLLASTKEMRLNQRGLYKDVMRGKGRMKLSEGTLVEGKDEKKIFEALGVPWRPPEHRIC